MADFDERTKLRIIMALARFDTPADIVKSLREEGFDTNVRQIGGYDPSRNYYDHDKRFIPIFDAEREQYLKDVQAVPIAQQGFRLNALMKVHEAAMRTKNYMLANATVRQAAEEVGGLYTNERKNLNTNKNEGLTEEERRAMLADVINEMMPPPAGAQAAPKTVQ